MNHDPLSDVLSSVRLRGAVFYYVSFGDEWVAQTPAASELADALMPGAEHVLAYHLIAKGAGWAVTDGVDPVRLTGGDIVMFPRGDAHLLSSAPGMRAKPDDSDWRFVTRNDPKPIPVAYHHGVLRPGSAAVLERVSEMVFVDAARRYLESLPEDASGWLAALRDRHVGKAIGLMHERPAEPWTIDELGRQVGLSRSALHERFADLVGQPPMQYLANWRIQRGAGLLREGRATVATIAQEVGYESEAAFARAFKRLVGQPPAAWRRAQRLAT